MSGRAATTGVIPGRFGLSVGKPDIEPPEGWRWTKLTDVARLETGHTPSRRKPAYWDGDVPWIGIKDARLYHGRVIPDTIQHTTPLGIENSAARVLPTDTVCLSRTASIGYVTMMGQPMATSQDFVNWVCSDELDPKFLMSLLIAESESLNYFSHGSTHQTIYFPEVKAFHVCLPPIDEQRRIGAVLGALDDRIEVNRRMNRTLEAMAQALFRRRFVDFGGRDDLVEHDAGPIPEGWWWGKPTDLIKLDPRMKFKKGTVARYLGMSEVPTEGFAIGELEERPYKGGSKFILGDTLLARITPSLENGKTALVDFLEPGEVAFGSTEFIVMRGREGTPREYVYCLARSPEFRDFAIQHMTGSSGRQRVKRDHFDHYDLPIPPRDELAAFAETVRPMFDRISVNHDHSRTLAALRDVLLPKLVSGELRVPEAEEAF